MTAPFVRAAFANGYAEYAATPSDEAKDLCRWLMEQSGEPAALVEAARHMARVQAVKDTSRQRKDALATKWQERMRPLFRTLARATAAKVAHKLMPREAIDPGQSDTRQILIDGITEAEWIDLLTDAWRESVADGHVVGMAFISVVQGGSAVSFDHEFPAALDALRDLQLNDATQWVEKILNGTAYTVGQEVADALENGATYDDLVGLVSDAIAGGGDANLVLDTMLSTGVSAGSIDQYQTEGVTEVDILTSAIDDECADAAGQNPWPIAEADGMLPFHANCVLPGTAVSPLGHLQAASRAWYDGPFVLIRTAGGRQVSATPNHPVLTWRGWIAAQELREGDHVLSVCAADGGAALDLGPGGVHGADAVDHPAPVYVAAPGIEFDDVPPRIDEVFQSLRALGDHTRTVGTAADFHGDGQAVKGEIHVVRADGFLAGELDTQPGQLVLQGDLVPSARLGEALVSEGAALLLVETVDPPTRSLMGGGSESTPLLSGHASVAQVHGGAAVADRHAVGTQPHLQGTAAEPQTAGEGQQGFPVAVAADEVVKVEWSRYVGHVYDLQTSAGAYIADGVVVHNCRCAVSPHFG